jgi:hypothetical protein
MTALSDPLGAIASLTIVLALPGPAWAQPGSGDAPVTVMRLPASPIPVAAAAFTPVGTVMAPAPFLGGQTVPTFAVPPDGSSVGWWVDGPLVGSSEMAILLGHNQVGGGYAVFNRLDELHPGDQVTVADGTGSLRANFRITQVISDVPKNDPEALRRVLSGNAGGAQLALITCGGDFDVSYRASADNVVAFAARS